MRAVVGVLAQTGVLVIVELGMFLEYSCTISKKCVTTTTPKKWQVMRSEI